MKNTGYKLSNYNYYTINDDNELLLFNTLNGTNSLIKFSLSVSDSIIKVLKGDIPASCLQDKYVDTLYKYGYIIDDDTDELSILRKKYVETINNSTLRLIILPTEKCNFGCKYCYESSNGTKMTEDIKKGIIKYLHQNIHKYTGLHISWFGGEPLEALEIIYDISERAINLCRKYGKRYSSSMTTNAFELDIDTFKRLLKYKVISYQITIDGVKSIHDIQRPHKSYNGSTFDVIIKNLLKIKNEIKSSTFRITIRSNFSRNNLSYVNEYKQFFYNNFSEDKRFAFFVRPVMDWGGSNIKSFQEDLIDNNDYSWIYQSIINCGNTPLPYIYGEFLECGSVCYAALNNSYVIDTKGNIYKCTCDFQNDPRKIIGNIDSNGKLIIDNTKAAKWICNINHCSNDNCFYKPVCFGDACPSSRIIDGNTRKCPLEKKDLDFILRLLDKNNKAFVHID